MAKILIKFKNQPENMSSEQLFEDKQHLDDWISGNDSIIINPVLTSQKLTFERSGHTAENPNLCEGTIIVVADDFKNY